MSLQQSWCYSNTVLKRELKIPTLITTGGRNRASNMGWGGGIAQQQKTFHGI